MLEEQLITSHYARAALNDEKSRFIFRLIGEKLLERLTFIKVNPKVILDLGSGDAYLAKQLQKCYVDSKLLCVDLTAETLKLKNASICANAYRLPFANHSVDVIFSNLLLPWCNDITQIFLELRRVLRKGGLLLFSSFGPDTLYEIRTSWLSIDNYQHTHSFLDMHDVGDCMLKAFFTDPVVDCERITVTYPSVESILMELKNTGSQNLAVKRCKGLTGKNAFQQFKKNYAGHRLENKKIPATVEIIYGQAWG